MTKPRAKSPKVKFGTTLPADMPARLREYADREGMFVDQIFASALNAWFDAMDGKGAAYKPTHLAQHRQLEALLNSKDPAVLNALAGVLEICERLVKA